MILIVAELRGHEFFHHSPIGDVISHGLLGVGVREERVGGGGGLHFGALEVRELEEHGVVRRRVVV